MQCDERSKCYQGAWHGKHGKMINKPTQKDR